VDLSEHCWFRLGWFRLGWFRLGWFRLGSGWFRLGWGWLHAWPQAMVRPPLTDRVWPVM
jgi:hypothetical protein